MAVGEAHPATDRGLPENAGFRCMQLALSQVMDQQRTPCHQTLGLTCPAQS